MSTKVVQCDLSCKKQSVFATSAVAAPADSALHVDSDAPRAGPADGGGGVAQGLLLDQLGVRLHLPQREARQAAAEAACVTQTAKPSRAKPSDTEQESSDAQFSQHPPSSLCLWTKTSRLLEMKMQGQQT